jgi:hypothetical protein
MKLEKDEYGNVTINEKKYRVKKVNGEEGIVTFEELNPMQEETFKKMFNEIVNVLAESIDKKALMKDVLKDYNNKELMDLHNRIFTYHQPVKAGRGCYNIKVGKKEILIRD